MCIRRRSTTATTRTHMHPPKHRLYGHKTVHLYCSMSWRREIWSGSIPTNPRLRVRFRRGSDMLDLYPYPPCLTTKPAQVSIPVRIMDTFSQNLSDVQSGGNEEIFGGIFITLQCRGGECLHYSQAPGYVTWFSNRFECWRRIYIPFSIHSCTRKEGETGYTELPENQDTKLMADHIPTSSYFSGIAYSLSSTSTSILSNVSRSIEPCQIMVIMGTLSALTAGKSTLMDILWGRRKSGEVSGTVLVNGREVDDEIFQEDRWICGSGLGGYSDEHTDGV
ncbi:hypothetical protein BDN70DRAFT_355369 [Pholiota conissans]|uniref:Uncharacterized protein n=1 Tax=Pholiota conissans TaxID=109636 RepID=A0A9P5YQ24_9AGAR|nr:hypothetical protein BDN70DRAFT_355369 [Pholiota conissans]